MTRKLLFSAQKNEGPFLLEWIAYHKMIGFTDIVVVSNDCEDGSDHLLDQLAGFGEITHINQDVPDGIAPQKHAEQVARKAGCFADGDWVMWLDVDEFLLPRAGDGMLDDLIAEIGDADAVMVAWRYFGDGGNDVWPGRHISDRFIGAAPRWRGKRGQVKTLFRYGPMIERLDIHRPILKEGVGAAGFKVLTSCKAPPAPAFYDRTRKNPFNRMPGLKGPYRLGMVAHFSIRTPDMFALKAKRGDGYFPPEANPVVRDDEFYRKRNLNAFEERGLLHHEAATVREMQRLLELQGISDACEAIEGFRFSAVDGAA